MSWRRAQWLLPSLIWHALGLALFVNWSDVLHNPPIHYTDYASHYAEAAAAQIFLDSGHVWGYDPFFHAGFAGDTLYDVDNKGVEVACWLLSHLGLPLPHAFDVVMLSLMALSPFCVYLAARVIGLAPRAAGLAQLMALTTWYSDPTVRWMWQGGTLTFASVALGTLAVVAAYWRWAGLTEKGAKGQSPSATRIVINLLWFGLGAWLFWFHLLSFFLLVIPLGVATLMVWRRWTVRTRLVPVLWAGWVLLLNWPWLSVALRFLHTKNSSAQFLQGGLPQLLSDAQSPYIFFRVMVWGLSALGLWLAQRHGLRWCWPLCASLVAWLVVAYAGVYFGAGELQPHRFVMPALVVSTIPAAYWLARAWEQSPRRAIATLIALGFVSALSLYNGWPSPGLQPDGTPSDYLGGPQTDERAVCQTLRQFDLASGRVLATDWRLGAYLPTCSGAQVIGGPFIWVWTIDNYSNVGLGDMLGHTIAELNARDMTALLAQYNVHWVVINEVVRSDIYTLFDWQRDHPDVWEPIAAHGPFKVYGVSQASDWFLVGSGEVRANYNRLEVRHASPGGVTLKYHWLDSLRAEPTLPLHPIYIGQDPVPFIAVDNGSVANFVVAQHYD